MVSHVEAVIILGDEVDPAAAVKYSAAVYGTSFPRRKITLEPKNFDGHSMWYSHETQFELRAGGFLILRQMTVTGTSPNRTEYGRKNPFSQLYPRTCSVV